MTIKIPKVKAVITPSGPAAQEPGVAEPKIETPAKEEDVASAAAAFIKANTASGRAEETAAPVTESSSRPNREESIAALSKVGAKGRNARKINKKLEQLQGQSGQHLQDMHDAADGLENAYTSIRGKMGGLVVRDQNESNVDLAGDLHKHIYNVIEHARINLEAAANKELAGNRSEFNSSQMLDKKAPRNVHPEDLAGRDDYLGNVPSNSGTSLDESLDYLDKYASNKFVTKTQNFESMSAADHANHARNLLAAAAASAPIAVNSLRNNAEINIALKNSGQSLPTVADVKSSLNPHVLAFNDSAQKHIDFLTTSGDAPLSKPKTVYDMFGLDHHLKRLNELAKAGNLQRQDEAQHNRIRGVYQRRYGDLLAKRAAGRGHIIPQPVTPVKLDMTSEGVNNRAAELSPAIGAHPFADKWNKIIDKAKVYGVSGDRETAHRMLDTVQNSMEKNGITIRQQPAEVRAQKPDSGQGRVPSYSTFAKMANVGKSVIETPSDSPNFGIADPRVDLTWGGRTNIMSGMRTRKELRGGPAWVRFEGGNEGATVMNPSVEGFHIPSDTAFEPYKRESRRQALLDAAAAAQKQEDDKAREEKARQESLSRISGVDYYPYLAGDQAVAPLDFAKFYTSTPEKTPRKTKSLGKRTNAQKLADSIAEFNTQNDVPGTETGTSAQERADALFSNRERRTT